MIARNMSRWMLALATLVVSVSFAAEGHAQGGKKPPPPDPKVLEALRKREMEQMKKLEDEILRQQRERNKKLELYNSRLRDFQKKQAEGKKFAEAEVLREAYLILASAEHDCEGHRAKAMTEIQSALKILDESIMKKGTELEKAITKMEEKAASRAKKSAQEEPEASPDVYQQLLTSSPRLHSAREYVVLARQSLEQGQQVKPLQHVNTALAELDAALKATAEIKKFLQAEALRHAYVLLAWCNHYCDGHRHKAMSEIQAAIKELDAEIMKNGSALLKTKEAAQKKALAAVKTDAGTTPDVQEIQRASHQLLKDARAWLILLRQSLDQNGQETAKHHVLKAIREIDMALIRVGEWTKFRESVALKEAYLLLSTANENAGGHREKAMHDIEAVITILDPKLFRPESALEDARDALKQKHKGKTAEDEVSRLVSKWQIENARGWLIHVRHALARNEQTKLLSQVDAAIEELNLALKDE